MAASDFGLVLVDDTADSSDHGLCAPRAAYFTKHGRGKSRSDFTAFFGEAETWMIENPQLWEHYLGDSTMTRVQYLSAVGNLCSDPMATWSRIRAAGADMDPILHAFAILMETDIVCAGSGSADFATIFWAKGHPPASPEDTNKAVSSRSGGSPGRVVILQDSAGLHCYGTAPGSSRREASSPRPSLTLDLSFADWEGSSGAGGGGGASAASLGPDRTVLPELEAGDRLLLAEEVSFALRQVDWVGCVLARADQVLFKFGADGRFVGSNLKKGKDTQSKTSLVVTYDDGEQAAHSEFDFGLHGVTYRFVGSLLTSRMRRQPRL